MARMIVINTIQDTEETRLLGDGWEQMTTISEPRLSEAVECYESLGYEVLVRQYRAQGPDCSVCFDADERVGKVHGTVYIRKRDGGD